MRNQSFDFIVVGAGIAGLTAAYELKKQGKSVLVLENNSYPGGRMSAITIENIPLSLGAQFIASFYSNMNLYLTEFKLSKEKLNLNRIAIKKNGRLHYLNAENPFSLLNFKGLGFVDKTRLLAGLILKIIEARGIDIYDLKTYSTFDNKTIYDDLIKLTGQGAFDYFIDPMLNAIFGYSSKEFSKAMFLAALSKFLNLRLYTLKGGINKLILELAKHNEVRLNTRVISIQRLNDNVVIKAQSKNGEELSFEAKRAIIAVPGNMVLPILANPDKREKDFFSQVEYSNLGYVFFKSKELIFTNIDIAWLPNKESSSFASVAVINKIKDMYYYSAELRKDADEKELDRLIKKYIGIKNFQIIYKIFWQSAVPKFKPGYLTEVNRFVNKFSKKDQIFYCGDYLEMPSTEGALTSGLKMAKLFS